MSLTRSFPTPDAALPVAMKQIPLFPKTQTAPALPSDYSLARHFSRFIRCNPHWLERGVSGLPALVIAFLIYLSRRLPGGLSATAARKATEYARRRSAVLWVKMGQLDPEDVPPDLARQFRRQELRALVHAALGRHLKTVRQELVLNPEADSDPVPELLARYAQELGRALNALLGDAPPRTLEDLCG